MDVKIYRLMHTNLISCHSTVRALEQEFVSFALILVLKSPGRSRVELYIKFKVAGFLSFGEDWFQTHNSRVANWLSVTSNSREIIAIESFQNKA